MSGMTQLVFWIVAGSAILAVGAVLLSWGRPSVRIWPPPDGGSWEAYLSWAIVGITMAGPFVLGILDFNSWSIPTWIRFLAGVVLVPVGFGVVLVSIRQLTIAASLGLQGQLVTSGPYCYSRNPQCVALIVGYVGFALLCNSLLSLVVTLLLSVELGLSPFAEEPWLRERFGQDYEDYARRVPRFLGITRASP